MVDEKNRMNTGLLTLNILQKRLDIGQKVIIDTQMLEERGIFAVWEVIKSWVMAFCSIR